MKKKTLLLLAAFSVATMCEAQFRRTALTPGTNGQSSLLTDGRGWHYRVDVNMGDEMATTFTDAFIHGDTIIDGRTCKKLYVEFGHDSDHGTPSTWFETLGRGGKYHSAWYEEGYKVYRIMDGGREPELVFDFGLHVGDRLPGNDNLFYWYDDYIIVDGSMADDGTRTTSRTYRRMRFAEGELAESPRLSDWCLIEGVGGNEGILHPESCATTAQDGFISERFTHCDQFLENKGGIPVYENLITREDFMTANTYRPFVVESRRWNCVRGYQTTSPRRAFGSEYFYILRGDTVILGKTYKKLYVCGNDTIAEDDLNAARERGLDLESDNAMKYYAALREEAHKVYWIRNGGTEETLLYSFDEGIYNYPSWRMILQVASPLMIPVNPAGDDIRRTFMCECSIEGDSEENGYPTCFLAEGIGCDIEPFKPEEWANTKGFGSYLSTIYDGDVCIYDWWQGSLGERYAYFMTNGTATQTMNSPHSSLYFDLQGRRLTREPVHGIFIKDGKKVMR